MFRDWKQKLFYICGWIALALGILGVYLPLLPTTPFILLAAFCFSRGSERWHKWLLEHPLFGSLIKDWERHGVIRPRVKALAITMMTLTMSYPVFRPSQMNIYVKGLIVLTWLCVSGFILTRPSHPLLKSEDR